ncbi:hypothetical protein [Sphingobium sp. Cam5-1]|uniref:hypothetical protein n=1 Tax=Sphingobium sp. Cam5-1 TaxID=2789327 RepID=UPI0018AD2D18|nr:hypothetical protein [Sphingobium sp. Cam5-1]QPI75517.1 hypothetical protein IZV00_18860 [Sphingobium sp. Cam5-1]
MANHFVKASFMLAVTRAEAEIFRLIDDAIDAVGNPSLDASRSDRFAALGPAFAACFPPSPDDPFNGFLELFSDPDYPRLGFTVQIDPPGGTGEASVWMHGDQVDIEAAAALIQCVAKSALPYGFEYALDCDRMRPGEFGGGYVVITRDDIEFGGSAQGLERALTRNATPDRSLILATRDAEEGLLFWNAADGFGSLERATVYSEAEAAQAGAVIADDEPEWLVLPARR